MIRDALLDDIRNRSKISDELQHLDFAGFSVDLAFSAQDSEYHSAKAAFIERYSARVG